MHLHASSAKQHQYHGFVNYISDNNGFSLRDLFCYEQKHNEDNGEENRDGSDWNLSANYGVEGRSRKQRIVRIRERQMCNAVAVLFLAQGVPLLYEGDETGDSQERQQQCILSGQSDRLGELEER